MTANQIAPFTVNGWTISPCDMCTGGYMVTAGSEKYPERTLDAAVRAAQRFRPCGKTTTGELDELNKRLERYEKNLPSWADGTPEDYDAWIRDLTPDDNRLRFYQWIGSLAVAELVEESRKPSAGFDGEMVRVSGATQEYADGWNDGVAALPLDDHPYPSVLPLGHPFCDNPGHTHTDGGSRLPYCGLGSEE